jgi:hypothetical protein
VLEVLYLKQERFLPFCLHFLVNHNWTDAINNLLLIAISGDDLPGSIM